MKQAGVAHTILNHRRKIKIVISLLCTILWYSIKHSRDITTLIVLLWCALLQLVSVLFYRSTIVPTPA